jgi:hypothetical protein
METLTVKRTAYMQWLINQTIPLVPMIAIEQGTIKNAHETAIAEQIQIDVSMHQKQQAFALLEQTGDIKYNLDTFMKAAHIVT